MILQHRSVLLLNWRKLINQYSLKSFRRDLSFQDVGINIKLARSLRNHGIRNPTEIQEKAIQSILSGENSVINSETGSGKTLAYALPIVNKILEIKKRGLNVPRPYALVVVLNMELQHQVSRVFSQLLGAKVCQASEDSPLKLLNTEVVVSVPAYLMTYPLDVFKQVQTVVFDEADILIAKKVGKTGRKDPLFNLIWGLQEPSHFQSYTTSHYVDRDEKLINAHDESFIDEVKNVTGAQDNTIMTDNEDNTDNDDIENTENVFSDGRQFVFVGATMPNSENKRSKFAMRYIQTWFPNISVVQSEHVHHINPNVEMVFNEVLQGNKFKLLVQTLRNYSDLFRLRVLVFVNKYETATSLYGMLTKFDYPESLQSFGHDGSFLMDMKKFDYEWEGNVHILHKNIQINDRLELFHDFSLSQRSLIVTTDVASRGVDFPDVDLVIQYDFATNVIDILHRAGRTGRMGKEGKVINFITKIDERLSLAMKEAMDSGESLENLFSRRRGLGKKLKLKSEEMNQPAADNV